MNCTKNQILSDSRTCSLKLWLSLLFTAALISATHAQTYNQPKRANSARTSSGSGTITPQGGGPGAHGNGTANMIPKWLDSSSIGDSIITEASGNIGIGTASPASRLSVTGMIETTLGGYKFPDGTIQTTAATGGISSVVHDATLTGNGTTSSPLGVAIPLTLTGSSSSPIVRVTQNGSSFGLQVINNGAVAIVGSSQTSIGVRGFTQSGAGVSGASVSFHGVEGTSQSGAGVQGTSNSLYGVEGLSTNGTGVHGMSTNGVGVLGESDNQPAVEGDSNTSAGVIGSSVTTNGVAGSSQQAFGVFGTSANGGGVLGLSANNAGVQGISTNSFGVIGGGVGANSIGVFGQSDNGTGIYGRANSAGQLAGKFDGDVQVNGNLSKSSGSFKIDHPLDPENKYLYHSFVESPDMMNIYNGNITTDENGEAIITLPDWFEALNKDFRYQLTVIGTFAQAIVASEVKENRFSIKSNAPNVKVSWQVTGVRHDGWANKHRIPTEEAKSEQERGFFLHPELLGQPEDKSVEFARNPEMMQRLKTMREQLKQKAHTGNQ